MRFRRYFDEPRCPVSRRALELFDAHKERFDGGDEFNLPRIGRQFQYCWIGAALRDVAGGSAA